MNQTDSPRPLALARRRRASAPLGQNAPAQTPPRPPTTCFHWRNLARRKKKGRRVKPSRRRLRMAAQNSPPPPSVRLPMDQAYPQGYHAGNNTSGGPCVRRLLPLFFPLFLVASAAAQDPAPPPMWPVDPDEGHARDSPSLPRIPHRHRPPHPRPDLRHFRAPAKPRPKNSPPAAPTPSPASAKPPQVQPTRSSFPAPPTISSRASS